MSATDCMLVGMGACLGFIACMVFRGWLSSWGPWDDERPHYVPLQPEWRYETRTETVPPKPRRPKSKRKARRSK